jgi:hypothetical protein
VSIKNDKIKVNPLSAATEDRVETIVYTVSDGKGGTDTAKLKVNVGLVEAPAQPDAGSPTSKPDSLDLSNVSSFSGRQGQDTGTATVSNNQSSVKLEGSAWKSLDLFGKITEETVLTFDFKSNVEGEIQGIGFANESDVKRDLKPMFFQLDGSEKWGIQDFSDTYETGSGFKSYAIPVGEYFTGSVDHIVLVNDDDAGLGSMSTFSHIGLIDGIA